MKRIVALFVLFALPAFAADEPKKLTVDMTARVLDFDNKPIKDAFEATKDDPTCAKCPDLTLGTVIWNSINQVLQDDTNVLPRDRQAWVFIAAKVRNDSAAVLGPKERDALIDRVGKVYSKIAPVISVRAPLMIDPNWSVPELK